MVSLPLLNRTRQRDGEAHAGNQMCRWNTDNPPITELHFSLHFVRPSPLFCILLYALGITYIYTYTESKSPNSSASQS